MAPTVSIILCTFNGARYLRESIDSVLQQTYTDLELIVVIDGSTDGTAEIVASYRDPRLRVVEEGRRGLPQSLNLGFERARGRYYSYTSDDNAYLPDAIGVMVAHLDAHPGLAMVCTDFFVTNASGRVISYNDTDAACFLYTAEAARKAGPYRPEFRLVEDVDFFLRLYHFAGRPDRISRPYYRYRVHGESLSAKETGVRQLISLKLHCDLVARGIEEIDLEELFADRMSLAALYRRYEDIDQILALAGEKQLRFASRLERQARFLRSRPGWLVNRVRIAARSQLEKARRRVKLAVARVKGRA